MEVERAIKRYTRRAHNKAVRGLANGSLVINVRGDIVSPAKSAAGLLAIGNLAIPYAKGQTKQSKRAAPRARRVVQQGGFQCGGDPAPFKVQKIQKVQQKAGYYW